MTRVFVYEWCCATAARGDDSRAASLWAEGWAMLSAALADFCRVPEVRVRTFLSPALRGEAAVKSALSPVIRQGLDITWSDDEPAAFRAAAADADFALVIAPEFDTLLETRCRWAVKAGATLLGPSPEAVGLAADKLALAGHWRDSGVRTPETVPAGDATATVVPTPFVLKERFGAGSQRLFIGTDSAAARHLVLDALGGVEFVLQPLVAGTPVSVAFLIGPMQTSKLIATRQFVSVACNFRYLGGQLPIPGRLAERASRIAGQAIRAVPGLRGFVGVDVVLGDPADGSGDYAIEINPRLTTSYVGLRVATDDNLMGALLGLVRGDSVPMPRWRPDGVRWTPDGKIERFAPTTDLATP